ncbi:conserved hypothetical protein [Burkholderia mallei PRL-20]|uniref:Uncharacterized protein n=2 Tax=Burkholderia pseudomallei TaxID=28450 RepID=A0A0E1VVY0_BURPE|nr:hypothetical protein BMASAVP1_1702 [Burkholderia mallei SAVP1]ABN88131.1 hypothetical protein BURPS668_A2329 [Burkholderia pseudomallei 668]ABN95432.1 hypothetical protein BURPS1106A_A2248 [Burkholderia pseudomallei 1106a]ABO02559.1 hypothetical protein BMA10247_A0581 [Burkholderia mallei NCTC 10247]EBA50029.1 hypothetical protein BURPS305_5730 [Burkholderia pseudomallei 305]EDK86361.1 hypothetical protein BMA721280_I0434 [Burkholderia mallei 2002721280]EDU12615.1 hypothetical protein BURP
MRRPVGHAGSTIRNTQDAARPTATAADALSPSLDVLPTLGASGYKNL